MQSSIDKILPWLVFVLVLVGFFIFSSASLGLLARDGANFSSVAFSQIVFGILGGGIALVLTNHIHYYNWRKYGFYIFLASVLLTLLVFVPGLGFSHGGATRWVSLGIFTIQPSEFLKIGFIIYLATWLSGLRHRVESFKFGLAPILIIISTVSAILLLQPDTDTCFIMIVSALAMFAVAGCRFTHLGLIALIGILMVAALAFYRPYVMDRFVTLMDPHSDPQGSGYQIRQSLIAVGSGGLIGRGFGQSIQKFEYLPEPISDSIFAVYAEEFGFIGSLLLVCLFTFFTFRGYKIATTTRDSFGTLLVVGFVTMIVSQAFLNIAAMLGLMPISGLTLPFISHGGSALLSTLASVGIILNVSKHRRRMVK